MAGEGDSEGADRGGRAGRPTAERATSGRAKSAVLWGLVGGFAFLVLAQGYLIVAGALPVGYGALLGLAVAVGVAAAGIAYVTEHRLHAERVKRRT